jgi:hypothetical protein
MTDILEFKSKSEITKAGYTTYPDAAKAIGIGIRQLFRYRKDGLIDKIYGRTWNTKRFPLVSSEDLNIVRTIKNTPRRDLVKLAQTTTDTRLKDRLLLWLNPFARR